MPRKPTIQFENAFYHVRSRGVNKQILFYSEKDYYYFEKLLYLATEKFGIQIYSHCLMSNHYHLFISTPKANISKAMQWINMKYALYFLKTREGKDGHVFKGRYKKTLVQEDRYAMVLIRYIHHNPVKAKLCTRAEDWLWSSYPSAINRAKKKKFINYEWMLEQFGNNQKTFQNYHLNDIKLESASNLLILQNLGLENTLSSNESKNSTKKLNQEESILWQIIEQNFNEKSRFKLFAFALFNYLNLPSKKIALKLGKSDANIRQICKRVKTSKNAKKLESLIRAK
jgi:REP element-mobilizing transposase RayT